LDGIPIHESLVLLDVETVHVALVARVAKGIHWFEISIPLPVSRSLGVLVEGTGTSQVVF
jgi:hypothetical protein